MVAAPAAPPDSPELLPDLVARAPDKVRVKEAGGRYRLIFGSASANVGAGPLELRASRPDRSFPTMRADQLVRLADGTVRRYQAVGIVRFVVSTGHRHWHFLRFMRYDLRREADGRSILRDRKTGFCLGDRFRVPDDLVGRPRTRVFRGACGKRRRDWLRVREGISVGYGDSYAADLEGQYLDVTALPHGRYLLVHTVNADGNLRELTRSNDVSSVLLDLSWRRRRPSVRVLASCAAEPACASRSGS